MELSQKNITLTTAIFSLTAVAAWKAWSCGGGDYDIAPNLFGYPERHAVKKLQDLMADAFPKRTDGVGASAEARPELMAAILDAPKEEALKKIDAALQQNRAANYTARLANFLWDVRDLVAVGTRESAPREEWTAYVKWRAAQMPKEKRGLPPTPSELNPSIPEWLPEDEKKRQREAVAARSHASAEALQFVDGKLATASPALAPHWLVVRGGITFRQGNFAEAEKSFHAVMEKYHAHPRCETATYMFTRLKIEQYRRKVETYRRKSDDLQKEKDLNVALQETMAALDGFSQVYPKSRYAPEIPGWKGALDSLAGSPWEAIHDYLAQLDQTDHPEIIESACHELERCFESITNAPEYHASPDLYRSDNDVLARDVARHPLAAMRVIYFMLDGVSSLDLDLWRYHFTDVDEVRQMISRSRHPELLQALSRAVVEQEKLYNEPQWKPDFLAILAWVATESGEHTEALRLCEKSRALLKSSDDLRLVHAVVLERLGRFGEAADAYTALEKDFPNSPLLAGVPVRLANMLRKTAHSGDAMLELFKAVPPQRAFDQPALPKQHDLSLNDTHQVDQMADAISWFAPLAELQKTARKLPRKQEGPYPIAPRFEATLRARLLAHEDFRNAMVLLDPPAENPGYDREGNDPDFTNLVGFTPRRWEKWVQPLMHLHSELAQAKGAYAQAQLCWALALAWEKARGKIIYPIVHSISSFTEHSDEAPLTLRQNGLAMGYPLAVIQEELDSLDELSHTLKYSLRTATLARGTPLGAQALFKANECLKQLAVHSLYQHTRAYETNAAKLSRRLYDRLQQEYPGSREARQAVWWTFPSPLEAPGMTGRYWPRWDYSNASLVLAMQGGTRRPSPYDIPAQAIDWTYAQARNKILEPLLQSAENGPLSHVREEIQKLHATYDAHYTELEEAGLFNYLADFEAMLSRPGIDEAVAREYILTRLGGEIPDDTQPAMKPLADFIEYQKIVRHISPETRFSIATGPGGARPLPEDTERQWKEFLDHYPQTPKREAVFFQLARAAVREVLSLRVPPETVEKRPEDFVGPPDLGFNERLLQTTATHAAAALNDYEKNFPQGRYLQDIHLLRGQMAVDLHDYPTALRLLCQVFDDPKHRELQADTAEAFASCVEDLDQPERRIALIEALAKDKIAFQHFHIFLHSNFAGGPLRPYEDFIQELAGKN